jgi:hypothetical protein
MLLVIAMAGITLSSKLIIRIVSLGRQQELLICMHDVSRYKVLYWNFWFVYRMTQAHMEALILIRSDTRIEYEIITRNFSRFVPGVSCNDTVIV